jgi:hypothetical protein
VPHDPFQAVCDQLSGVVDALQFERMRWARDEGPKLAHLVALALGALGDRPDLEFSEEGSTTDVKRYALKVHGIRVIGVTLAYQQGQAHLRGVEIARSAYTFAEDRTISADFAQVDEAWMAQALGSVFALVCPRGVAAAAA